MTVMDRIITRHPYYPERLKSYFIERGETPKAIFAIGDFRLLAPSTHRMRTNYKGTPQLRTINKAIQLIKQGNIIVDYLNLNTIELHQRVYAAGGKTIAVSETINSNADWVLDILSKGGLVVSMYDSTDCVDKTLNEVLFESLSDESFVTRRRFLDEHLLLTEDD